MSGGPRTQAWWIPPSRAAFVSFMPHHGQEIQRTWRRPGSRGRDNPRRDSAQSLSEGRLRRAVLLERAFPGGITMPRPTRLLGSVLRTPHPSEALPPDLRLSPNSDPSLILFAPALRVIPIGRHSTYVYRLALAISPLLVPSLAASSHKSAGPQPTDSDRRLGTGLMELGHQHHASRPPTPWRDYNRARGHCCPLKT